MKGLGVVMLLAVAAAAAPGDSLDRSAARRLAKLGERAREAGQEETARCIFERVLQLDPDQSIARKRLGHRRVGAKWEAPKSSPLGANDFAMASPFRGEWYEEEERRADAIVRAGLTDRYLGLLDHVPRHAAVHKALGHERVGGRYARPEFVAAAKRYDGRRIRWPGLVALEPPGRANVGEKIPGIGMRAAYPLSNGNRLSGTLPERDLAEAARALPAANALFRELFGRDIGTWSRPVVVFVPKKDYERIIKAVLEPGEKQNLYLRRRLIESERVAVFRADSAAGARDIYAHTVGNYSAGDLCAPKAGDETDAHAYAWFSEGMGYFVSMATVGTGMCGFISYLESNSKTALTVPRPDRHDRENLLPWLQTQIRDGTTLPMREVCGRNLNSLDLLLSMQAWSFLEFLAAYDADAFRILPHALRAQEDGASYAERSDRALKRAFKKNLKELEPLWRAFVLEIM